MTSLGTQISLHNARVRITFDLQKGSYSAWRLPDNTAFLLNAYAQLGTTTTLGGRRFSYAQNEFEDRLGAGRRLRLRGVGAGGPDLLLEFSLYDRHGFFTVSVGVINTTRRIVQLREIFPLKADAAHGGGVFLGPDPARDHRLLTGEGDAWCPQLLGRLNAKSANVMLLTHLKRPVKESLVLGGLTTYEFLHRVGVDYAPERPLTDQGRVGIDAWIRTWDPAGKQIQPDKAYLPDPALVDFSVSNPYDALEQYARTVATAMNVRLNTYGAMIPVCLWYLSGTSIGENTSAGALREARLMKDMGLAAYAPPLVRLMPNAPVNPNPQMWWDDEHWRRFGYLAEPLETVRKWTAGMAEAGAGCDLALQPSIPSSDYANSHPDHMLFNSADKLPDITDPGFQSHLREVYRRLRDDGVKGLFFDYCGTMLLGVEGGFENPEATAVSAYRNIFALAREAAGPQVLITENANGRATVGAEAATGLIDAKRSENDKVTLTPRVIKRGIREWYRNRTTKLIDPDVKNFEPYDGDLLRAQVTAMATMFGKTMLGSSVTRYTPEAIHTLGRTLPMSADAATARPVGLFETADDDGGAPNPEVYTYPLGGGAHLLMLWNHSGERAKTISALLGGDTAFGGTGLDETQTYDAWDIWDWDDLGRPAGGSTLAARVRPGELKTIVLHPAERRPYVLTTTRHLLPALGAENVRWDTGDQILRGRFHVIAGDPFRAIIKLPVTGKWLVSEYRARAAGRTVKMACHNDLMGKYVELRIESDVTREVDWTLEFSVRAGDKTNTPGTPRDLEAELDEGEGTVDLSWDASYRVDDRPVRYLVYRDTRPDFTPALDNRILVTLKTAASDGDIRPGETYYYQVMAEDGGGRRSRAATARLAVAPAYSRALLNGVDATTGGNWTDRYGKDGYALFSVVGGNRDKNHTPSYVEALSYRGQKGTTLLTMSTEDPRALAYNDETTRTRRLGALAAFQDLYLEFKLKDEKPHAVALYFVNWEGLDRRYTIEVLDGATRRPLTAPFELSDFRNGKYIQYLIRGSVIIKISRPESSNGVVLGGIFFDEPATTGPGPVKINRPVFEDTRGQTRFSWQPEPGVASYRLRVGMDAALENPVFERIGWETAWRVPGLEVGKQYYWSVEGSGPSGKALNTGGARSFTVAPAVTFVGFDDQTLGNWRARHGKAGHLLPAGNARDWGDAKRLPDFIESVNSAGSQYFSWINTGKKASPAAPESPTGATDHNGSAIFDHWYLVVDIKAKDQAEHTVSFYNWLGAIYPPDGMDAWIEVLDPESGQVLDRRYDRRMLNGPEGRYFTYRFRERLMLRLRNENGPYCFLNGIFWEK